MKEAMLKDYGQEGLGMCYLDKHKNVCQVTINQKQKQKILEEQVLNNQVVKIQLWFQPGSNTLQGWNMGL